MLYFSRLWFWSLNLIWAKSEEEVCLLTSFPFDYKYDSIYETCLFFSPKFMAAVVFVQFLTALLYIWIFICIKTVCLSCLSAITPFNLRPRPLVLQLVTISAACWYQFVSASFRISHLGSWSLTVPSLANTFQYPLKGRNPQT